MTGTDKKYEGSAERVTEIYGQLAHEGLTDYEILDFIFSELDSLQVIELLSKCAKVSGIEVNRE